MTDFIDAIIAEHTTPVVENTTETAPKPDEQVVEEKKTTEGEGEQQEAAKPEEAKDPVSEQKKLENALAYQRKKRSEAKQLAETRSVELEQLKQKLAQYEAKTTTTPKDDGAPKEADFTNYADYLEAVNEYKIEKRFAERDAKQQETTNKAVQSAQDAQWESQRIDVIDKQSEEFAKDFPDVDALFNENAELVKSYSPQLKRALLAADNAPLAFYNLAKDGKLDELGDMSLEDAKVEIRLAQLKTPQKIQSKAPAPLSPSRGSVATGKSINDLKTPEEMYSWFKAI